jgi:hypothetical protein
MGYRFMTHPLEPLACKIHDSVVCSGTDEEQVLAFDWYQKQALQEPCPACEAIQDVLEDYDVRPKIKLSLGVQVRRLFRALIEAGTAGAALFAAGAASMAETTSPVERWTTSAGLTVLGISVILGALLDRRR